MKTELAESLSLNCKGRFVLIDTARRGAAHFFLLLSAQLCQVLSQRFITKHDVTKIDMKGRLRNKKDEKSGIGGAFVISWILWNITKNNERYILASDEDSTVTMLKNALNVLIQKNDSMIFHLEMSAIQMSVVRPPGGILMSEAAKIA